MIAFQTTTRPFLYRRRERSQRLPVVVGLLTVVGLLLLSIGTDITSGGPDFHGNSGPMMTIATPR